MKNENSLTGLRGVCVVTAVSLLLISCSGTGPADPGGGTTNGGELSVPEKKQRTETIPFNLYGMHCQKCPNIAKNALEDHPDILKAMIMFDSKTGWVRVKKESDVSRDDIRTILKNAGKGFTAVFPGEEVPEKFRETSNSKQKEKADEKVISRGEKVDLKEHLVDGKITIFDFYAKWCRGCQLLEPKLTKLAKERSNLAIRRIDIQTWSSPAAKQAIKEYTMAQVPYVRIYDRNGSFLGEVKGNDIEKIKALLPDTGESTGKSTGTSGKKPADASGKSKEPIETNQREETMITYEIDVSGMT